MTSSRPTLVVALAFILILFCSLLPDGTSAEPDFKSSMSAKFSRRNLNLFKGTVRDIETHPVAGASITAIPTGAGQEKWAATTDAEGRFLIVSEITEEAVFVVSKQGYRAFQTRPRKANEREIEVIVSKLFQVFGKVMDSESLQPVESFRIVPGESYSSRRPISWHHSGQQIGKDGLYAFVADRKGGNVSVAIEASGYLPASSPRFKAPGWHNYDFALKKGLGLAGRVELPGGGYAESADLFLAVPFDEVELDETGRLRSENFGIAVSNSKGEFQFAARFEPQTVFAAHADGFVRMDIRDFAESRIVRLEPWGQVDGIVDAQVPAEVRRFVQLRSGIVSTKSVSRGLPAIKLEYSAVLGADGHFSFSRVPPGDYELIVMLQSARDEHGESRILGTLSKEIVVSKTENGANEPFDVGTLRLQIKQKSNGAPVAPVF